MPLPNILEFIGTNITQRKFQEAQEKLLNYLGIEVPTKTELNSEIAELNNTITSKADKTYVDSALTGFTNGAATFYSTLAEANADIANIKPNTANPTVKDKVDIGEIANGGTWYKASSGATTLTKSPYDALTQAKADATTKANTAESNAKKFATSEALSATAMIQQTSTSNLHEYADKDGNIVASINSIGEVEAIDFKTENGNLNTLTKSISQQEIAGYTHAFTDSGGNIVFGIKQDGTVVGSSTSAGISEMRAGILSSDDMNTVGLNLDAKYLAETPLNYTVEVSPYGTDGTLHQRMPSAIKISDTRIFVAYAQFSTEGTDGADGRLVGRFVDFDLVAQTSTVSATIEMDGNKTGSLSRHPVFIKLRDKIVCIFNSGTDTIQMESFDKCQTWVNRKSIKISGFPAYHLGLDTAIQIESGEYAGRVCLAAYSLGASASYGTVGIMYSDDNCKTWNAGGTLQGDIAFPTTPKINETSLALDASQNLVLVMRHEDYTATNRYLLFATSNDGGQTIKAVGMNPKIATSACQVGFKQFAPNVFNAVPKIIMSHPTVQSFNRRMFRIRVSYDNCQTFISEYAPFSDTLDVAYSSICVLDKSRFALVYEEGQTNVNQSIKVKFLNLSEVI